MSRAWQISAPVSPHRLALSAVVFLALGFAMNGAGHLFSIAWFKSWWQVVPCYLGYVLPLALFVRGRTLAEGWRIAVSAFIPLELIGYAIGSSVIAEGNVVAALLGPHNFTLAMVLIVSPTPFIGNAIVDGVERLRGPPPVAP